VHQFALAGMPELRHAEGPALGAGLTRLSLPSGPPPAVDAWPPCSKPATPVAAFAGSRVCTGAACTRAGVVRSAPGVAVFGLVVVR